MLVVFHKQLSACLERIPLRIIWQFLLCSQFSTPVSAWSLSSPFPWFSLPQIAWQEKPIMWGPLPLTLELSVLLKSHCRPRGENRSSCGKPDFWRQIEPHHIHMVTSISSTMSLPYHGSQVWQSKLLWCCGIISSSQSANGGQFNLIKCILW